MAGSPSRTDRLERDCVQANSLRERPPTSAAVPKALLCSVCKDLLVDPTQATCGDRYCLECFTALVKGDGEPACPVCGETIDRKLSWPDVFAAKEISLLEVYCPNRTAGCRWSDQLKQLKVHLLECQFALEDCPNLGCTERMLKALKTKHLEEQCLYRLVHCQHCDEQLVYKATETHLQTCPSLPVTCPNNCMGGELMIPRNELAAHLQACPNRKDECGIISCTYVAPVDDMVKHMDSNAKSHLELVNNACVSLQQQVQSIGTITDKKVDEQRQIQKSCQDQLQSLSQQTCSLEEQVTELASHQKIMQQKTLEACYQSVDNLQKEMKAKLDSLDHHLRGLTEKCIKFEEIVAMQSARIQQLEEEAGNSQQGSGMAQTVQQQFQAQDRVLAAHDIKLAEHGLRLDMMDCKNTEGVLLWKITEIRRRRREAVSGKTPSIYSQPFYTSSNGYKMCARLYLNGDGMGRGTHLSLFFVVMRNEYDCLLPWPFQQKVTLILIDQDGRRHISDTFRPDPSSSSFKQPRSEMNIASGCPLFVSLATLDGGGYIKDDTMFIKVVVDANELYRPDSR